MRILKGLLFLLFLRSITGAAGACPISTCGHESIRIRFPFQLQDQNCGYPGFNLSCNTQRETVLKLPYSGDFFVRGIDYTMQLINLYDPDNCIPRRLLRFNLSGSPFVPIFSRLYAFLSCPSQFTKAGFTAIDCLGNSTNTVLATSSVNLVSMMPPSCKIIATVPVPVTWPDNFDGLLGDLNADLHLKWNKPDCGPCEAQGKMCGFQSNTSQEIRCLDFPITGGPSKDLRVLRILCFSIGLPAMAGVVAFACFACFTDSARGNRTLSGRHTPAIVSPQPAVCMTGLDESTIQSYEKLVLGESGRPPGPNDGTCPICLSEYCTKETVRYIPECKHCFHVDCIDEWLRMNSTCPVCRKSPVPDQRACPNNDV